MNVELILWRDSHASRGTPWIHIEDCEVDQPPMLSVGIVMKESAEFIFVVPHFSRGSEQVSGDMRIPKIAILERKIIHEIIEVSV